MNKIVSAQLKKRIKGKTLVLGVGNPLRGDDGAGPAVADGLQDASSLKVINCYDTPEKYTRDIVAFNPDTIIIIDIVDFSGRPGEIRIIEISQIIETAFSTHRMALKLLARYVKAHCDADIFLLAIKPAEVTFNKGISKNVQKSINGIIKFISKIR